MDTYTVTIYNDEESIGRISKLTLEQLNWVIFLIGRSNLYFTCIKE